MVDFSQRLISNASGLVSAPKSYPTNLQDCVAGIDSNFGTGQEKQAACQTFLALNEPQALDAMAMGAHSFNHPILAGWYNAKANYLRGGSDVTTPPSEIPPFPKSVNECMANMDEGYSSSSYEKQMACELLLNELTTASALELAAEAAENSGNHIYAAWCRQAAKAKKTGTTTGDKENDLVVDLPTNQNECLLNIDANMPQEEKLVACSELFNEKNKADDFIDFANQAGEAGYPIAKGWFTEKAAILEEKSDYTKYYYIGGGIAAFVLIFGIGYAIAKR